MKKKLRNFLVILGAMFLCSATLLLGLSVLIWHFDGASNVMCAGVVLIYIITNVGGGFMTGSMMGQQKFFWGLLAGAVYFSVLLLLGIALRETKLAGNLQLVSGAMVCIVSGMFGGMLAPARRERVS